MSDPMPPPGWNPQQPPAQQPFGGPPAQQPPGFAQPYPPQQFPPQQQYPQQYPPQYQAPMGYQPYGYAPGVQGARTNGLAVTSMVLGIVGIVLFCLYGIAALLAIIFGGVALKQMKDNPGQFNNKGMAITGLVLGIIGVSGFIILIAVASNSSWYIANR